MAAFEGKEAGRTRPSSVLYTVPNALSVMRGLLGPIVMGLITYDIYWALLAALALMIFAELSDFVDGFIARRFNQASRLGEVIDPVCDSIYHLSVFFAFLYNGWMAPWMLFLIYARDLAVPYIRAFARQAGREINVRNSGKIKTAVHAFAQIGVVVCALGAPAGAAMEGEAAMALLLLATAASLYSLADYGVAASKSG